MPILSLFFKSFSRITQLLTSSIKPLVLNKALTELSKRVNKSCQSSLFVKTFYGSCPAQLI